MSDYNNTTLMVAPPTQQLTAFACESSFEAAQRMAKALSSSTLVPTAFQGPGNIGNCLIALEIAQRIGASPLMVAQNLNIIHGRPSWSSQFVIAAINSCGRFSPLRFQMTGEGDDRTCVAWATDKTGERLESPLVSLTMAKKEGWYGKNGSKWQTMPELMLRYRAATFFGRLYAPDLLMGMGTMEEALDVGTKVDAAAQDVAASLAETPAPGAPAKRGRPRKEKTADVVEAEVIEVTPPATAPATAPAPDEKAETVSDIEAPNQDIFG